MKLRQRLAVLCPLLFAIYLPVLAAVGVILGISIRTDIPIGYFFSDPASEFNAPMYVGLFSNFGVLLWCAAASICVFGSFVVRGRAGNREIPLFLLCSGLLTSVLMLDDLYLMHEEVLPDHFYVPQPLVFVVYGCLLLAYFVRFRETILQTEYILLSIAVVFFGLSIAIDVLVSEEAEFYLATVPLRDLFEDGFKLFGILTWSVYLIGVCIHQVRPLIRTASPT